jgi:putative transposase
VFHYGIELEGLKYNCAELGELRRRMGTRLKVDLTFDAGDLGHINVLDPVKGTYIHVPAVNQAYARRLSLWQHRVIRRYAQRHLSARTDVAALAQAKAEIRALVERDFHRKSTRGRKRHARFIEDHTGATSSAGAIQAVSETNPSDFDARSHLSDPAGEGQQKPAEANPAPDPSAAAPDTFTDDEVLPVYEADLDLPRVSVNTAVAAQDASGFQTS